MRFSLINIDNKPVLYNLPSSFSGTHFVAPRSYQFQIGVGF